MCGLCGALDFRQSLETLPIDAMVRAMAHRGPDDHGTHRSGPVVLGHARLSILDLSSSGHQPMQFGALTMAYNGEVYNFAALRARLEQEGATFHSRTDSEVILQAYARWGAATFAQLDGMFALAIFDAASQRLILARDRFGIKPLYLARSGDTLLFASEIKALLASGRLTPTMHWQALSEYLWFGNALTPHTMFDGITRLPPGHTLTVTPGGSELRAYWKVEEVTPITPTEADAAQQVQTLLDASVKMHLVSDVPVGVFLSGGIDSSAITAFASRAYHGSLHSYAVDFELGAGTSELAKAQKVAEHFGTVHHAIRVSTGDLAPLLERLVGAHDEPFADAANIPLFLLCQALQGEVKVVLQGDGGDELFAGYRRYNVLSAHSAWHWGSRVANAIDPGWNVGPRVQRARRFVRAMSTREAGERMALLLTVESYDRSPLRALRTDARTRMAGSDPFARYREMAARFADVDAVQQMLLTDLHVQLPDTFLEKVDKPTMANSVEVRVPFLENALASYAVSLPSSLKVRRGQKKHILRRALRGVVPDWVLDAPKAGFDVPYRAWIAGPLLPFARERLLDARSTALCDAKVIQTLLDEHSSGRADHGFLLWKLLHLALWMDRYNVAVG